MGNQFNAYSVDLRERVVNFVEQGHTRGEAAEVFQVHRNTVGRWVTQYRETRTLEPKPMPKRIPLKMNDAKFLAYLKGNNDKTLVEMGRDFKVSGNTIWHACCRLNITRKKNTALPGSQSARQRPLSRRNGLY